MDYDEQALKALMGSKELEDRLCDQAYLISLPSILGECGVGLVYTQFVPDTVYAAVRRIEGRSLVQIAKTGPSLEGSLLMQALRHAIGRKHEDLYVTEPV